MQLVTIEDVRAAARQMSGAVVRTPLVPCVWSDDNRPLWLKPDRMVGPHSIPGSGAPPCRARL
jgi:threonine dehydratase